MLGISQYKQKKTNSHNVGQPKTELSESAREKEVKSRKAQSDCFLFPPNNPTFNTEEKWIIEK